MDSLKDRTLEVFKQMVPYLRGALWWAKNDLIKDRQPEFNQEDDAKGHPLLAVSKREVTGRFDAVPMLVGTSGLKFGWGRLQRCVLVTGMTRREPDHKTYFGSIVSPGLYSVEEMMVGVRTTKITEEGFDKHSLQRRNDERGRLRKMKWYEVRPMVPNWDKPKVNDSEMEALNRWCQEKSEA